MLNKLNKLSLILMVAYPLVAFICLYLKQPLFIIAYLLFILSLVGLEKCIERHWFSATILLSTIASIFYLLQQIDIQYLIYLPPILILLSLFILFSQSLTAGKTPIISIYAKLLGDTLEERHLRYNRSLTILWSIFFLLMTISSCLLAVFSNVDNWSLFTHVISYLLVGLFFIIEFMYRKYHFSGEIKDGFFQFINKIIKIRPASLWKNE